jgi:hypothetical protein
MKAWLPALGAVLLSSCANDRVAGGSTSETSNGLTVQVIGADGTPAARTRLRLRPKEYLEGACPATSDPLSGIIDTVTDDSGFVRFSRELPSVHLEAYGSGLAGQDGIDSGKHRIVLHLAPTGTIRGKVGLQVGDGPVRVQVRGLEHAVWTDSSGAFALDSLPSGPVRLRAWNPHSNLSTESVFGVPAGGASEVGTLVPLGEAGRWTDSARVVLNTRWGANSISGAVDSVPILVHMDGADFPVSARPTGSDLRVADSTGKGLPFSVAQWSTSSRIARFWVLVPSVRAQDSIQWFRLRWGNPLAEDASTPWTVFSASSGWSGVWDFNRTFEDRNGRTRIADASSWGDHGLLTGTPGIDPVDGLHFGTNARDGVTFPGAGTNLHGNFTVLFRARPERSGANFLQRGDSTWNHNKKAFYLGIAGSAKTTHKPGLYPTFTAFADTSHNVYSVSNVPLDTTDWAFLVARHTVGAGDSGSVDWFVAGSKVSTTLSGGMRYEADNPGRDSLIVGWRTMESERFRGAMAEVWILGRAVGDDWVKLESECRKPGGGSLVRLMR